MPWIVKGLDRETGQPRHRVYERSGIESARYEDDVRARASAEGILVEQISYIPWEEYETPHGPPRLLWKLSDEAMISLAALIFTGIGLVVYGVWTVVDEAPLHGDAIRVIPVGLTPIYALGLAIAGVQILALAGMVLMTQSIRRVAYQLLKQMQQNSG